ncbi:MAG: NTP transferase domain-containing protein [Micrococcales bacterium]|nr:NTP transferase domain-containing protein [Micrococcales bacterium]
MHTQAIVLAGGRATRLGGAAKPALTGPDGRTALRRALDSCSRAGVGRVVVVGPPDLLADLLGPYQGRVSVTQEDPPWSGPARGIAAGLACLAQAPPLDPTADEAPGSGPGQDAPGGGVLVLACDMPDAAPAVLALVRAGLTGDGRVAQADGRRQWLLGLYRLDALAAACSRLPRPAPGLPDPSVRELLDGLDLTDLPVADGTADDLDTQADLVRLRFSFPLSR